MNEERAMPQSEEAERGTLGALLLDAPRVLPLALRMLEGLGEDAFYCPPRRIVWARVKEMGKAHGGAGIDLLTVANALKEAGELEKIGGSAAVDGLVDATPSYANAEYYLDIVRQNALRRRAIVLANEVMREAYAGEGVAGETLLKGAGERFLGAVPAALDESSNLAVMEASIARWREAKRQQQAGLTATAASGLATPWAHLTELLCGLEPGLTILAARPSAGKTTLEDILANYTAMQGLGVARVTLDSTRQELLERALARKAGVSLPRLKFGYAHLNQLHAVDQAAPVIGGYPMWINVVDRDIRMICAWVRGLCAREKIALITADYARLIGAAEMGRSEFEAAMRVSLVSGCLKKLSLELGIPLLLLVQLNREYDKGERDPRLSDLSDSGSLEQDASKVIFLYQNRKKHKEMENARAGATRNVRPVFVDVAKNKNGKLARLAYWMLAPYFIFEPAAADHAGEVPLSKWQHLDEIAEEDLGFAREEGERKPLDGDQGNPEETTTKAPGHEGENGGAATETATQEELLEPPEEEAD